MAGRPHDIDPASGHPCVVSVTEHPVGHDRRHERSTHAPGRRYHFDLIARGAGAAQDTGQVGHHDIGLVKPAAYYLRVGFMYRDPGSGLLPQPAGQAVVIGMHVGDEQSAQVSQAVTGGFEAGAESAVGLLGVPAGVDNVGTILALNDINENVSQ
jgi:hypothetical protein